MINVILKKLVENKDLTKSETRLAFEKIMSGELSEIEAASFLTALQMKGPVYKEIIAALEVIKMKSSIIKPGVSLLVDTCGTGGDNSGTFNISTAKSS